MKKIIIFAAAITSLTLTSCQDFLDVKAENQYSSDAYFENDDQAAKTISRMYYRLRDESFYSQSLFWEEIAANVIVAARAGDAGDFLGKMNTMKYDGNIGEVKKIYSDSYGQMANASWVISSLLEKEKSQKLTYVEGRTLGEAYFMRAFYHLLIAYRYGCKTQGVPFVAWEDVEGGYKNTIPPQLASVTDNFAYIVSDLEKAEVRLPSINEYGEGEKGRASSESAIAMRVRANAFWATWDPTRWDNVIADVTALENMGRGLATLDEIYSDEPKDYFNKEYCFGFPSRGGKVSGGSYFPMVAAPYGPFGCPVSTSTNAWGEFYTSLDLYEEMLQDGDGNDRLKASIAHSGETIKIFGLDNILQDQYQDAVSTGFYIHKWNKALAHPDFVSSGYVGSGGECQSTNHCLHVIRFAECLLFRAEAYLVKGNTGAAGDDINAVHMRSVGAKATRLAGTWTALYHERRCELCFEASPYMYNLKRWALSENQSASSEIRTLAKKELESKVRYALWEKDASGSYTGKYSEKEGSYEAGTWEDYKICMPYPTEELDKAVIDGEKIYKQNPGYSW